MIDFLVGFPTLWRQYVDLSAQEAWDAYAGPRRISHEAVEIAWKALGPAEKVAFENGMRKAMQKEFGEAADLYLAELATVDPFRSRNMFSSFIHRDPFLNIPFVNIPMLPDGKPPAVVKKIYIFRLSEGEGALPNRHSNEPELLSRGFELNPAVRATAASTVVSVFSWGRCLSRPSLALQALNKSVWWAWTAGLASALVLFGYPGALGWNIINSPSRASSEVGWAATSVAALLSVFVVSLARNISRQRALRSSLASGTFLLMSPGQLPLITGHSHTAPIAILPLASAVRTTGFVLDTTFLRRLKELAITGVLASDGRPSKTEDLKEKYDAICETDLQGLAVPAGEDAKRLRQSGRPKITVYSSIPDLVWRIANVRNLWSRVQLAALALLLASAVSWFAFPESFAPPPPEWSLNTRNGVIDAVDKAYTVTDVNRTNLATFKLYFPKCNWGFLLSIKSEYYERTNDARIEGCEQTPSVFVLAPSNFKGEEKETVLRIERRRTLFGFPLRSVVVEEIPKGWLDVHQPRPGVDPPKHAGGTLPCSVTSLTSCSPIPPEVDLIPEDDHYRVQTRGDLAIYAHSKNRRGSSCYQWRVKPNVGKILAQGCEDPFATYKAPTSLAHAVPQPVTVWAEIGRTKSPGIELTVVEPGSEPAASGVVPPGRGVGPAPVPASTAHGNHTQIGDKTGPSGVSGARPTRTGKNQAGVEITVVPPAEQEGGPETGQDIAGRITGVAEPQSLRVVLFARARQGADVLWYVQPFVAAPFTKIQSDGTWSSRTHTGDRYRAFLVERSFSPPSYPVPLLPPCEGAGIIACSAEVPGRRPQVSENLKKDN